MTMSIDGSSKDDRGVFDRGADGSPGRYLITQPHERRPPSGPAPSRGKGGTPRSSPVYALGQIGYDRGGGGASAPPRELRALLRYLDADPSRAADLPWTLEQGGAPVYALRPGGSLSAYAHGRLYALLRALAAGRLARVSVPGVVVGRTTLASGRLLP